MQENNQSIVLPGVFVKIYNTGVFITGESRMGKSELALNLVDRKHQLIADDATLFTKNNDQIIGSCPNNIQNLIEVYGLGILNIKEIFGSKAVCKKQQLHFILSLQNSNTLEPKNLEKLSGFHKEEEILRLKIPVTTIPVDNRRNLAIIAECATKKHMLAQKELQQKNICTNKIPYEVVANP